MARTKQTARKATTKSTDSVEEEEDEEQEEEEEEEDEKRGKVERKKKKTVTKIAISEPVVKDMSIPSTETVTVYTRVRPFSQKEASQGNPSVVTMPSNNTVLLEDTNSTADAQTPFTFKERSCLWSHDDFQVDDNGKYKGMSKKYVDQNGVMETIGASMVERVYEGYNCGIFAYGQTGSGKTFTLNNGDENNPGLAQQTCHYLFEKMKKKTKTDNSEWQISLSMLESYNEQIRDLLNPHMSRITPLKLVSSTNPHSVRHLTSFPVKDYAEAYTLMQDANENKMVEATKLNTFSSRSHTFIYITLTQHNLSDKTTNSSTITVADLAGSENNVGGEAGERLQEASMINKSLNTMGQVISELTNPRSKHVSWRNSRVTMLLKEMLSGNSYTSMLATLSPSAGSYGETKATLRYALRCEQIKTKVFVKRESMADYLGERMSVTQETLTEIQNHLKSAQESSKSSLELIAVIYAKQVEEITLLMKRIGLAPEKPQETFYSKVVDATSKLYMENKADEAKEKLASLMLRLTDDLSVLLMMGRNIGVQQKLIYVQQLLERLPSNDETSKVKENVNKLLEKTM